MVCTLILASYAPLFLEQRLCSIGLSSEESFADKVMDKNTNFLQAAKSWYNKGNETIAKGVMLMTNLQAIQHFW